MNAELYGALLALALVVVGSIMAVVRAWTNKVLEDLAQNTQITRDMRNAANGRLQATLRELAYERDRNQGLREVVRERDNRLAFLQNRMPRGMVDALMHEYGRRREDRVTPTREQDLLAKLLDEEIDCPVGTDAARFKPP